MGMAGPLIMERDEEKERKKLIGSIKDGKILSTKNSPTHDAPTFVKCQLCERKTKKHFEDESLWIAKSPYNDDIVVTLKRHTSQPNLRDGVKMGLELNRLFGDKHQGVDKRYRLDFNQKDNLDHYHIHLRK